MPTLGTKIDVVPARSAATRLSWTTWQEDFLGDIDDLGNDRVLLTQAGFTSEIVEVDRATGDVASRMTFTGGNTYRSERYMGCDFFDSVRYCEDLATRFAEVETLLQPYVRGWSKTSPQPTPRSPGTTMG